MEDNKKDIIPDEVDDLEFDFDDDNIDDIVEVNKADTDEDYEEAPKEESVESEYHFDDDSALKETSKNEDHHLAVEDEEEEEDKKSYLGLIIFTILVIIALCVFFFMKGCSKEKYEVRFDTNEGSMVGSLKVDENGKIKRPADPTKEGYIFVGWYLNDEEFDFDTEITGDITLEARWEAINNAEITGISLDRDTLIVEVGGEADLVATLSPEDAKKVDLVWSSSNETVATVDSNGHIKALKAGTITISVSTPDGKFTATCTLTVDKGVVPAEGVTAKISSSTVVVNGSPAKITVSVTPTDATDKTVTYTSSDPTIATVDKNGYVKGLKEGKVTITVKTSNGKTAKVEVTVKPEVMAESITINGKNTVQEGKTLTLSATILPTDTTVKTVTWKVTNGTGQATINSSGKLTAKKAGTVTVTATTKNGKTATKEITITEKPKPAPVYLVTLTKVQSELTTFQYSIKVTKDGATFEYDQIQYNGEWYTYGPQMMPADQVKAGLKARIKLKDGTFVENVTVKIVG